MNNERTFWKNAGFAVLCFAVAFAASKWGVPYSGYFWLLVAIAMAAGIVFMAKSIPRGSEDENSSQDEWFNPNNGY